MLESGFAFDLNGEALVALPSGLLWIAARRVLVAADLHLEKGSAYAARGQMLPPWDTADTIARLEAACEALRPDLFVALGDSFHDQGAGARIDPAARDRLVGLASRIPCMWIAGNHDPEAPAWLPGARGANARFGGVTLRHEPTGAAPGEVAGHLHPCAVWTGRSGQRVRRPCFATDGRNLILPAFGAYAGGLDLRDPAYDGLFEGPVFALVRTGRGAAQRVVAAPSGRPPVSRRPAVAAG